MSPSKIPERALRGPRSRPQKFIRGTLPVSVFSNERAMSRKGSPAVTTSYGSAGSTLDAIAECHLREQQ